MLPYPRCDQGRILLEIAERRRINTAPPHCPDRKARGVVQVRQVWRRLVVDSDSQGADLGSSPRPIRILPPPKGRLTISRFRFSTRRGSDWNPRDGRRSLHRRSRSQINFPNHRGGLRAGVGLAKLIACGGCQADNHENDEVFHERWTPRSELGPSSTEVAGAQVPPARTAREIGPSSSCTPLLNGHSNGHQIPPGCPIAAALRRRAPGSHPTPAPLSFPRSGG